MKCAKCEKEIGADFRFCPYCGTKLTSAPKPSYNLAEFISALDYPRFEGIWESLKEKNADEAFRALKEMQTPATMYGIGVDFMRWSKHNTDSKPYMEENRRSVTTEAELKRMIVFNGVEQPFGNQSTYKDTINALSPEKVTLTRGKLKEVGKSLFFTEEECWDKIREYSETIFSGENSGNDQKRERGDAKW